MIDPFPCTGLGELFFASTRELKYPSNSLPHESAVALCRTCSHYDACGARALEQGDVYTVRAGHRLWLREEREALAHELARRSHEQASS